MHHGIKKLRDAGNISPSVKKRLQTRTDDQQRIPSSSSPTAMSPNKSDSLLVSPTKKGLEAPSLSTQTASESAEKTDDRLVQNGSVMNSSPSLQQQRKQQKQRQQQQEQQQQEQQQQQQEQQQQEHQLQQQEHLQQEQQQLQQQQQQQQQQRQHMPRAVTDPRLHKRERVKSGGVNNHDPITQPFLPKAPSKTPSKAALRMAREQPQQPQVKEDTDKEVVVEELDQEQKGEEQSRAAPAQPENGLSSSPSSPSPVEVSEWVQHGAVYSSCVLSMCTVVDCIHVHVSTGTGTCRHCSVHYRKHRNFRCVEIFMDPFNHEN